MLIFISLAVYLLQFFFILKNHFTIKDIAIMLGVSKRTVEYRLQKYELSTRSYTKTTDKELDRKIQEIMIAFPRSGLLYLTFQYLCFLTMFYIF